MQQFYQSILATALSGLPASPSTWGDCMRAAVASVLHIDPTELPNPHGEGHLDWGLEWFKALAPYGVQPVWVGDMDAWWALEFPGYWLATVETLAEEGGDTHCVVMLMDQLAHDPMPGSALVASGRDFKDDILSAIFFLPVDPSKAVVRR